MSVILEYVCQLKEFAIVLTWVMSIDCQIITKDDINWIRLHTHKIRYEN